MFERKIAFGPGYRIYFGKDGDSVIILLGGSTKHRQQHAIEVANCLTYQQVYVVAGLPRLPASGTFVHMFEEAVGLLPEAEQHAVVAAILRREMVVMAVSCGVVVFLVLRAASTA